VNSAETAVLEFKQVSKSFGGAIVIDRLSICFTRRERVVIFGPSGCGKTTVLRLAAGLEVPDSGAILMNGSLVADAGRLLIEPEDRGIGMVFQDLALWPHMSVRQNLEFGLQSKGISRSLREERVREALHLVDLEQRASAKPHQLSGGEQQRVALARALVIRPKILLMDEPLSSLDQKNKEQIISELLRLHADLAFTLLYVTHNREETNAIATRVLTLARDAA
jgi:ABC-type sugar transport system ATPase subunit